MARALQLGARRGLRVWVFSQPLLLRVVPSLVPPGAWFCEPFPVGLQEKRAAPAHPCLHFHLLLRAPESAGAPGEPAQQLLALGSRRIISGLFFFPLLGVFGASRAVLIPPAWLFRASAGREDANLGSSGAYADKFSCGARLLPAAITLSSPFINVSRSFLRLLQSSLPSSSSLPSLRQAGGSL